MRAYVFDLDGTLLDTLADIGAACNAVLGKHGYPQHPVDAYSRMVGNGFDILVRRALPSDRAPDACALADLTTEARAYYAEHMMEQTRPYPGMTRTLRALAESGIKLATLSNKPDAMSVKLIARYFPDIPFAEVHGARPDVPLKPVPDGLLAMLANIGADAKQTCYVGDSNVDIETAKNAGVRGVGAAWGFRGRAELAAAGADFIIDMPEELLNDSIRLA